MSISPNSAEVADRFAVVARRVCEIVDSASGLDRTDFLTEIYRILPRLIGEAISLPDVDLVGDDDESGGNSDLALVKRAEPSQERREQLFKLLRDKIGDWDRYWQVFDPTKDNEAIYGLLSDDIGDLYEDLKGGLVVCEERRAAPENLIWHWRVLFYSHWGKHAIDALRTIHFLVEDRLTGMD